MPGYTFLADRDLVAGGMSAHLATLKLTGVPYSKASIAKANEDLLDQANPDANSAEIQKRYPKAQVRDFDGDPNRVTEMDALVAYLQMLGTLVDVNAAQAQEQPK